MENTATAPAFTAGPWEYQRQNEIGLELYDVYPTRGGIRVAEVEGEANARLIESAPDLYKCARYLRMVCEDRLAIEREERNDPEVIEHYELLLADATAAIAKVEGGA